MKRNIKLTEGIAIAKGAASSLSASINHLQLSEADKKQLAFAKKTAEFALIHLANMFTSLRDKGPKVG